MHPTQAQAMEALKEAQSLLESNFDVRALMRVKDAIAALSSPSSTVMDEKGEREDYPLWLAHQHMQLHLWHYKPGFNVFDTVSAALAASAPSAVVGPHVGVGRNPHYEGTFEDETDAQAAQCRASVPAPSAAAMDEKGEREKFEAWFVVEGDAGFLSRRPCALDEYVEPDVQASWEAWQARAALTAPAPSAAEPVAMTEHDREMDQALAERDEREEVINAILDEVLGLDRHEWSSAYGFADAIEDVKTRMHALSVRSDAFEAEAAKFQAETLRASKLHAMLTRWVQRHQDEHPSGPGTRRCHVCELVAESKQLLAAPPPAPQPTEAEAMEPVEGDVLPPLGTEVLIHLARQDEWVKHTVAGYYVWPGHGDPTKWRVNVRVRDSAGYLNARSLQDLRHLDGSPWIAALKAEAPKVGRHLIRSVFMQHGFTIKDGQTDLKDYVYEAAEALLAEARLWQAEPVARVVFNPGRKKPDVDWLVGTVRRDTLLYTHPAPSAAEDAKDGERYRWLRETCLDWEGDSEEKWAALHFEDQDCLGHPSGRELDAAIDAAMAKGGGE